MANGGPRCHTEVGARVVYGKNRKNALLDGTRVGERHNPRNRHKPDHESRCLHSVLHVLGGTFATSQPGRSIT